MKKEKEMDIPYLDYKKHVGAIEPMGIPMSNIYANWSKEDTIHLQDKFNFYQAFLDSGKRLAKDNSYFYFSEDYRLGGGMSEL